MTPISAATKRPTSATIVITAAGYRVTADGVFTYRVNADGKMAALRAYWELDQATKSARKL